MSLRFFLLSLLDRSTVRTIRAIILIFFTQCLVGGKGDRRLLAFANEDRLRRILERMLDEKEFLSDYGIRSLSKYHKDNPWSMEVNGEEFSVHYWPGDSQNAMFGGNS